MQTIPNIPDRGNLRRVVIVGGGFGGLRLANKLDRRLFQVVLLDRDNFHLFQPLLYQVAITGLEITSIAYPFRKVFQKRHNVFFRMCSVQSVDSARKCVQTTVGELDYDYLVVAIGCSTNYFGNDSLRHTTISLKSAAEALDARNSILHSFEEASVSQDEQTRDELMNFVIVGGGATGVELAGAMADMKQYALKKDYPELDLDKMHIHLVDGSDRLLSGMSETSSHRIEAVLRKRGVELHQKVFVKGFDGTTITMSDGSCLNTRTVLWVSGITANRIGGFDEKNLGRGGRIKVDRYCRVEGHDSVYAIGDIACMETETHPQGYPQVAQVAIQMGRYIAESLKGELRGERPARFEYKDKGTLATIGRNSAVAEIGKMHFHGRLAWWLWLTVHISTILGVKNRLVILLDWIWNYMSYDSSMRVIIRGLCRKQPKEQDCMD